MKRTPAVSPEGMIKAMEDAAKGLPEIPAHVRLRAGDLPFWQGILRARARDEWIEVDLAIAAQLARVQRDIEVESRRLDRESKTLTNKRGDVKMNPRMTVLHLLSQREMALMRSLRMGGIPVGDPQIEAGRRSMQRKAEKVRAELSDDELLAV